MRVLVLSIDASTIQFLETMGMAIERSLEIESADEIGSWLRDSGCDAVVANIDTARIGVFAPRPMRAEGIKAPFIGISTGSQSQKWSDYRAFFLENGGDDLLHAPVNPRELVASLRACARRSSLNLHDVVMVRYEGSEIRMNLTTLRITVNEQYPRLTGKERQMLMVLLSNIGRPISKEAFLTQMYTAGLDKEPELKIIDVFICKLRKKLNDISPGAGNCIETVWGRGYLIDGKHIVRSTSVQPAVAKVVYA